MSYEKQMSLEEAMDILKLTFLSNSYVSKELIEKAYSVVKDYIDAQSSLSIGDEVYAPGHLKPLVVIEFLDDDQVRAINCYGDTYIKDSKRLKKTGKHYSQISDLLKLLNERD